VQYERGLDAYERIQLDRGAPLDGRAVEILKAIADIRKEEGAPAGLPARGVGRASV
jgi:hypothetical protein